MAECLHTFWCGRGSPGIASRTNNLVQEWDLTRPLPSSVAGGTAFDWVISMEVVEHIPPEYEAAFLAQITTYATKGTVLTWSDKGPSEKHPNARDNKYVLKRMQGLGFQYQKDISVRLRSLVKPDSVSSWFRTTVMVFMRGDEPAPISDWMPSSISQTRGDDRVPSKSKVTQSCRVCTYCLS